MYSQPASRNTQFGHQALKLHLSRIVKLMFRKSHQRENLAGYPVTPQTNLYETISAQSQRNRLVSRDLYQGFTPLQNLYQPIWNPRPPLKPVNLKPKSPQQLLCLTRPRAPPLVQAFPCAKARASHAMVGWFMELCKGGWHTGIKGFWKGSDRVYTGYCKGFGSKV